MPEIKQKIYPFLWFDTQAEEAAKFYTSIFDNSRIKRISRYGRAGRETHGKQAGSVMIVEFELEGQTSSHSTAARITNSTKRSRSRYPVTRRMRSTASGANSAKAARKAGAAG